ncbi:hypothetical protein ACWDF9_27270 [Streptomyces rubiginosohelvolus]
MEQHQRGARSGLRRIDRATRWTGMTLCWSHATAIALTATEAILRTAANWWVVAWGLTAALLIAWALLRAAQKRLLRGAVVSGGGEGHPCSPEEPADYDHAA